MFSGVKKSAKPSEIMEAAAAGDAAWMPPAMAFVRQNIFGEKPEADHGVG